MYKVVQVAGKRYRVNVQKFENFCTAASVGIMALAAFVFFFGFCWGGFLR